MEIRDNREVPSEVEQFLLEYESEIKWTEESVELGEQIELIVITNTDIFEGVLRYYNSKPILEMVTWNSWYSYPPELFESTTKLEI